MQILSTVDKSRKKRALFQKKNYDSRKRRPVGGVSTERRELKKKVGRKKENITFLSLSLSVKH